MIVAMRPNSRAALLVATASSAVFVLASAVVPVEHCTAARPCHPEILGMFAVSLLAAVPVMAFLHRGAALWAAVLCAVAWIVADRVEHWRLGVWALLPWALVAVTAMVARERRAPFADDRPWRVPPAPDRLPGPRRSLLIGGLLLAVAAAGTGWTLWHQHRVARQEAAARPVTAVVREHAGDGSAVLELPSGLTRTVEVLTVRDYPIGLEVELLVDGAGLRQLRTEPYDYTLPILPLTTLAGAGVALLARAASRRR